MKLAPLATGACALALLASSPSRGSVPGNLDEVANDGLLHVCRDVEPGNVGYQVCDERDFTRLGFPYTGSECAPLGLPESCQIDFIPGVRLLGRMTLIYDDHPLDGNGDPASNPQTTVIVELTYDWKPIIIAESFEGGVVGNWNPLDEHFFQESSGNIENANADRTNFQFSYGNLFELGMKIRDTAQPFFPERDLSETVPVLLSVVRDDSRGLVDAHADDTASAAQYRIVVRFARVRR